MLWITTTTEIRGTEGSISSPTRCRPKICLSPDHTVIDDETLRYKPPKAGWLVVLACCVVDWAAHRRCWQGTLPAVMDYVGRSVGKQSLAKDRTEPRRLVD